MYWNRAFSIPNNLLQQQNSSSWSTSAAATVPLLRVDLPPPQLQQRQHQHERMPPLRWIVGCVAAVISEIIAIVASRRDDGARGALVRLFRCYAMANGTVLAVAAAYGAFAWGPLACGRSTGVEFH
jgi:hypothetical protein